MLIVSGRCRLLLSGNFVISRTRLHVTDKAFFIAGPRAWNALPSDVKLISTRNHLLQEPKDTIFSFIYFLATFAICCHPSVCRLSVCNVIDGYVSETVQDKR